MTKLTRKPFSGYRPKLIKTDKEHQLALARIEELYSAKPGTIEGDELELLLFLVDAYEKESFPVELPDPIEAIRFRMEQMNLKQKDLVPMLGSKSKVSEVLSGKRELTLTMIRKLVQELGIPANVLLQERTEKLIEPNLLALGRKFPITEMFKRGWLDGIVGSLQEAKDNIDDVLSQFTDRVNTTELVPAFNRRNRLCGVKLNEAALLAWQIQIERQAGREQLPAYKKGTVTLDYMRSVAQLSYLDNGPTLAAEYLKKSGIHLIVEKHLSRTYLDGAAMRYGDKGRIVALTLRYDRLDNFWFVLMHELAHIALHIDKGECDTILDDFNEHSSDTIEKQADEMASEALIPQHAWKLAKRTGTPTETQVIDFAKDQRIHPAIVAGRIRHEKNNFSLYAKLLGNNTVRKQFEVV